MEGFFLCILLNLPIKTLSFFFLFSVSFSIPCSGRIKVQQWSNSSLPLTFFWFFFSSLSYTLQTQGYCRKLDFIAFYTLRAAVTISFVLLFYFLFSFSSLSSKLIRKLCNNTKSFQFTSLLSQDFPFSPILLSYIYGIHLV